MTESAFETASALVDGELTPRERDEAADNADVARHAAQIQQLADHLTDVSLPHEEISRRVDAIIAAAKHGDGRGDARLGDTRATTRLMRWWQPAVAAAAVAVIAVGVVAARGRGATDHMVADTAAKAASSVPAAQAGTAAATPELAQPNQRPASGATPSDRGSSPPLAATTDNVAAHEVLTSPEAVASFAAGVLNGTPAPTAGSLNCDPVDERGAPLVPIAATLYVQRPGTEPVEVAVAVRFDSENPAQFTAFGVRRTDCAIIVFAEGTTGR